MGMEPPEFDAEFFAVADGTFTVIVHELNQLPEQIEVLRQCKRRPPQRVGGLFARLPQSADDAA